jgi:hypothetical protein
MVSLSETQIRMYWWCNPHASEESIVRLRALGAVTFSLSFLLSAAASVHAQAPPPEPPETPPPLSGIAHNARQRRVMRGGSRQTWRSCRSCYIAKLTCLRLWSALTAASSVPVVSMPAMRANSTPDRFSPPAHDNAL